MREGQRRGGWLGLMIEDSQEHHGADRRIAPVSRIPSPGDLLALRFPIPNQDQVNHCGDKCGCGQMHLEMAIGNVTLLDGEGIPMASPIAMLL